MPNQWQKEFQAVRIFHRAVLEQPLLQGDPLHKVHDDISGIVFRKHILYVSHIRYLIHLRHLTRLFQETVAALFPLFLRDLRTAPLHTVGICMIPVYLSGGIIFFHGDLAVEEQVKSHVGDSKPALTDHLSDLVSVLQYGQTLHPVVILYALIVKSTVFAYGFFYLSHAVRASLHLYCPLFSSLNLSNPTVSASPCPLHTPRSDHGSLSLSPSISNRPTHRNPDPAYTSFVRKNIPDIPPF